MGRGVISGAERHLGVAAMEGAREVPRLEFKWALNFRATAGSRLGSASLSLYTTVDKTRSIDDLMLVSSVPLC